MQMPEVGDLVEVVLDTSHLQAMMAPCSAHRVSATKRMRGIVIETPPWMRADTALSLLELQNQTRCHIPAHRIVSIGDVTFDKRPETKDRRFEVVSSKTGEKYEVVQNGRTKRWSCTCVGYQFHRKCRHVARLAEEHRE